MRSTPSANRKMGVAFFIPLLVLCILVGPVSVAARIPVQVYAPLTPSSIPLLMAAQEIDSLEVTLFSNHSQAHTLFLRGDIPLLMTGLAVGVQFFQKEIPVQIVNSYVSGLTYLVTRDRRVTAFRELQGQELYLPFEGSPIEEITTFFLSQENLSWDDITPVYLPFPSSLELLKQGEARAVALPQPLATVAAAREDIFLSLSYKETWDALVGGSDGYPQVGLFVNPDWAPPYDDLLRELNEQIAAALQRLADSPETAVEQTKAFFQFPEPILQRALQGTAFDLKTGQDLEQEIRDYYEVLGKPLDETFDAFFYRDTE